MRTLFSFTLILASFSLCAQSKVVFKDKLLRSVLKPNDYVLLFQSQEEASSYNLGSLRKELQNKKTLPDTLFWTLDSLNASTLFLRKVKSFRYDTISKEEFKSKPKKQRREYRNLNTYISKDSSGHKIYRVFEEYQFREISLVNYHSLIFTKDKYFDQLQRWSAFIGFICSPFYLVKYRFNDSKQEGRDHLENTYFSFLFLLSIDILNKTKLRRHEIIQEKFEIYD